MPGLLDRAGNLKGTDFLHLYTLGSLALERRGADLYNMQAQSQLAAQRVPAAAGIRYLPLYPPQVSVFFAPLARLSYSWALALWLLVSAFIYGACCYAIWRACAGLRGYWVTVSILAAAYPAFWHLLAWGQTSALALACFTAAFLALRNKRDFIAGFALGCLVFKPQLGLAAAIVFLVTLRWRIIAGALVSAAIELMVGVVYCGSAPLREWVSALRNVPRELPLFEPKIYQTHCLRTFWDMLIPWPWASFAMYVIGALVVCALTVGCWRRRIPLPLRYSALLLASVLLSPHLTVYDLVILAPIFLLLANWVIAQPDNSPARSLKPLLYFAFVLPLLGPLARWTHFQFSVPLMTALLYGIWRIDRDTSGVGFGYLKG